MKTRRILIAANWKMNPAPPGFDAPGSAFRPAAGMDVAVFPSFVDIAACVRAGLTTGAQCGHAEPKGAHTGDVSMPMIRGAGCTHVLCGHSDRRREHGETNDQVRRQAEAALAAGLAPVVCVGETQAERDAGKAKDAVRDQLRDLPAGIVLAYEPVWAISRGDPTKPAATPQDAQEMHAFIRSLLPTAGNETCILYGGSMNGQNAAALLACPDVDGGLVGGASLKPDDFATIVQTAAGIAR